MIVNIIGSMKTRDKKETEEIADELRDAISSFYDGEPSPEHIGVDIEYHHKVPEFQKIIAIDEEEMPRNEEECECLVEEIVKITRIPWNSWGINQDGDGQYNYIYVDEENEEEDEEKTR